MAVGNLAVVLYAFLLIILKFNYYTLFISLEDTPFGEVKLGELGTWFSRRNKSPVAAGQAICRGIAQ